MEFHTSFVLHLTEFLCIVSFRCFRFSVIIFKFID